MRPFTKYAGIVASIILVAFGIGAIYMGVSGRAEVRDSIKQEQIVGSPDMDKAIAGKAITTGAEAKLFAEGLRKHTLAITDGQVYSQMGRFLDENGKPTSDEAAAAKDPKTGAPVENAARNIWVTSTALSTALNTSFFAESVATFAMVMGAAMLLIGTGFLVMLARLPWSAPQTAPKAKVSRAAVTA